MHSLHTIRTAFNDTGIVALSNDPTSSFLLYPKSPVVGIVKVFDCLNLQLIGDFRAHQHSLATIAITSAGNLAATASVRGTIIRVFSLPDMQKLFTFKRGSSAAQIYELAFTPKLPFLAATSSKGTTHFFMMDQ
jgi:autophagy-related protein 18